ncbi:acyltransferase family protein [Gorillibacterium massiliense]|uniref:acyltransferase family protein n=1 Tax=Gorillibacterium massiliense TaxID=1280390 RepID=UPI001EE2C7B0|nr:acyltransferase [Gorillibacterium massiliense]
MSATGIPRPPRERAIDLFKGLLVIGMIYCHSLQFFSDVQVYPGGQKWIDFINLITFSGFVFSFGYVSQLAYYSKPFRRSAPRMLLAGVKTLLAFYVSGTAFRLFIDQRPVGWSTIRPILLLDDMPGWSEFLASFTYVTIAGLVLFVPLKWLAERKWLSFAVAFILLGATFIPYGSIHAPQLAPLIGTRDMASFPVVQYFPYYLAGMLFARYRIRWDWRVLAAALLASGAFFWKWQMQGDLPERFPPSIWWIIGPAAVLYGYYLLAKWLEQGVRYLAPIEIMGRNVLWFLVMSNVMIFALKRSQQLYMVSPINAFWLALVFLCIVIFSVSMITKPPKVPVQDQQDHRSESIKQINIIEE